MGILYAQKDNENVISKYPNVIPNKPKYLVVKKTDKQHNNAITIEKNKKGSFL